jgi:hypothetical protein
MYVSRAKLVAWIFHRAPGRCDAGLRLPRHDLETQDLRLRTVEENQELRLAAIQFGIILINEGHALRSAHFCPETAAFCNAQPV